VNQSTLSICEPVHSFLWPSSKSQIYLGEVIYSDITLSSISATKIYCCG
jgi:hypothetical protein